jgi:SpoVK/Ycf46/Vps4 family AAA+-type ATPase
MTAVVDLGEWLTFVTCVCGAETVRAPCWDCTRAQDAAHETALRTLDASRTIPAMYDWAKLDAVELARRVVSREPLHVVGGRIVASPRVLLCGPAGAGKTSLAVACFRKRLAPKCVFATAFDVARARIQHRAGYGEAPSVEAALRASLLLLDDMGQESQGGSASVAEVIFERHARNMPTWITTGLSLSDIGRRYGDGILRRVAEGALIVQLGEKGE